MGRRAAERAGDERGAGRPAGGARRSGPRLAGAPRCRAAERRTGRGGVDPGRRRARLARGGRRRPRRRRRRGERRAGSATSLSSRCARSPRGAVVPTLRSTKRGDRSAEMAVRWQAALLDDATLDRLAAIMPGPVRVMAPPSVASRALVVEIIGGRRARGRRAGGRACSSCRRRRRECAPRRTSPSRSSRGSTARPFTAPVGRGLRHRRPAPTMVEAGDELVAAAPRRATRSARTATVRGSCPCSGPARSAHSSTSRSRCQRRSRPGRWPTSWRGWNDCSPSCSAPVRCAGARCT